MCLIEGCIGTPLCPTQQVVGGCWPASKIRVGRHFCFRSTFGVEGHRPLLRLLHCAAVASLRQTLFFPPYGRAETAFLCSLTAMAALNILPADRAYLGLIFEEGTTVVAIQCLNVALTLLPLGFCLLAAAAEHLNSMLRRVRETFWNSEGQGMTRLGLWRMGTIQDEDVLAVERQDSWQ